MSRAKKPSKAEQAADILLGRASRMKPQEALDRAIMHTVIGIAASSSRRRGKPGEVIEKLSASNPDFKAAISKLKPKDAQNLIRYCLPDNSELEGTYEKKLMHQFDKMLLKGRVLREKKYK